LSPKLALQLKLIGDVVRRDDAVVLIVRLQPNFFFQLTALSKMTVAVPPGIRLAAMQQCGIDFQYDVVGNGRLPLVQDLEHAQPLVLCHVGWVYRRGQQIARRHRKLMQRRREGEVVVLRQTDQSDAPFHYQANACLLFQHAARAELLQ